MGLGFVVPCLILYQYIVVSIHLHLKESAPATERCAGQFVVDWGFVFTEGVDTFGCDKSQTPQAVPYIVLSGTVNTSSNVRQHMIVSRPFRLGL